MINYCLNNNLNCSLQSKKKPYSVPRKERITKNTYQMSRWTPVFKDIVEDLIDNKLEEKHYPFLGGRNAAMTQTAPSRYATCCIKLTFFVCVLFGNIRLGDFEEGLC